jgi:hypothetical protein
MNSLDELNGYSQTNIEYQDFRPPTVVFDRITPSTPPAVNILEGQSHAVPEAINIIEIINYDQTAVIYTIDLRAVPGATAIWGTLPNYMSVSNSVSGVYVLSGMRSAADWQIAKAVTVALPNEYNGTFVYGVYFNYLNNTTADSKVYFVTVEVQAVDALSEPGEHVFNPSSGAAISNTPRIIDDGVTTPTYTLTLTPSDLTVVSSLNSSSGGLGGTSSYNSSTKVLTIVGTRAQVNGHLGNVNLSTTAVENDFFMLYSVSNNLNAEVDTKTQTMKSSSIQYLANPTEPAQYYLEETALTLTGVPQITDTSFDGSGTYTYTIFPSTTAAVNTISSTGTGGSSSFNSSTKVLTITGTRTQVNSHLSAVIFTGASDYIDNFIMYYRVVTPRGASATQTKFQNFIGTNLDEVSNLNLSRTWTGSQSNLIFATNTPQIVDADTTPNLIYTIEITGGHRWSDTDDYAKNSYVFTGTKAECNSKFSQIRYWPSKAASTSPSIEAGFFTFRLFKNSQEVVEINLFWSGRTAQAYTAADQTTVFTAVNWGDGVWRPTVRQALYATNYDSLVVGGGGGGGMGGGAAGAIIQNENSSVQTGFAINSSTGIPNGFYISPAPERESPSFNNRGLDGFSSTGPGGTAPGGLGGQRVKRSNYNGGNNSLRLGGTGITTTTSDIGAGGGGAGWGSNGANATGANTTLAAGLGGSGFSTWYGNVSAGGQGGVLRPDGSGGFVNNSGSTPSPFGSGGGGAFGPYLGTNSVPGNGRPGVVAIRIRA